MGVILRWLSFGITYVFRNWKTLVFGSGLLWSGALSIKMLLQEAKETVINLWPLIALIFLFLLLKEFIKGYFKMKR
ncbi:MAG: hypothetical protein U9N77_13675 [Thermodesulfobacteriota bacterium]|nr:hypothetical protein [Thermodesulfobacteriota bacterium]